MKILCITPIDHLPKVKSELSSFGSLKIIDDPKTIEDIAQELKTSEVIFTNPNKSKIYLGKNITDLAPNLKIICTASTGTNHIDKEHMQSQNIKVLAITQEKDITKKISSTAEHAMALTLSSVRSVPQSFMSVKEGKWDYTPFIGRQFDSLCIGIVGLGRLGSMYARFMKPLAKHIMYYDPYVFVKEAWLEKQEDLTKMFELCDIISLHVHVDARTTGLINKSLLNKAKENLLIVNTSRGEIVNEIDLIEFLRENKNAKYATDVLENEVRMTDKTANSLVNLSLNSDQVLITPHIGGMTHEAQNIAYGHAVQLLRNELV